MLNSSVSLGRTGTEVFLLSEFADDDAGDIINCFLKENGVSTEYLSVYPGRKSPLSLAFLNSKNDASYSFYEDFPEKRTLKNVGDFRSDDVVMFSSILAVSKGTRYDLRQLLDAARGAGAVIIYDPNIRPSSIASPEEMEQMVRENIGYADIVRVSDEDMMNIGGISNADDAYEYVCNNGCSCLAYTAGSKGVCLRTPSLSKYYGIPPVNTVSTIGAGDSFNAGIVYQLFREGVLPVGVENIPEAVWDRVIGRAISFASAVCEGNENYISESFAANIKTIGNSN